MDIIENSKTIFSDYLQIISELKGKDNYYDELISQYNQSDNKLFFIYAILFTNDIEKVKAICQLNNELSDAFYEIEILIEEVIENGVVDNTLQLITVEYGEYLSKHDKWKDLIVKNENLYLCCAILLNRSEIIKCLYYFFIALKINYSHNSDKDNVSLLEIVINKKNIFLFDCYIEQKKKYRKLYKAFDKIVKVFDLKTKYMIEFLNKIEKTFGKSNQQVIMKITKNLVDYFIQNEKKEDIRFIEEYFNEVDSNSIEEFVRNYLFCSKQKMSKVKTKELYSLKDLIEVNNYKNKRVKYDKDITLKDFIDANSYNGKTYIPRVYQLLMYLTSKEFSLLLKNEKCDDIESSWIEDIFNTLTEDECISLSKLLLEKEFFTDKYKFEYFIKSFAYQNCPECVYKRMISYLNSNFEIIYGLDKYRKGARFSKRLSTNTSSVYNEDSTSNLIYYLCHHLYFDSKEKVQDFLDFFKEDLNDYDILITNIAYNLYSYYIKCIETGTFEKYHLDKTMFREYPTLVYVMLKNGYLDSVEKCEELRNLSLNHKTYTPLINELNNRITDIKNRDDYLDGFGIQRIFEYEYLNTTEIEVNKKYSFIYDEIKRHINRKEHRIINIKINTIIHNKDTYQLTLGIYKDSQISEKTYPFLNYLKQLFTDRINNNFITKENILEYIEICSTLGMCYELNCRIKNNISYTNELFINELNKTNKNINALLYIASISEKDYFDVLINIDKTICDYAIKDAYINYLVNIPLKNQDTEVSKIKEFVNKFNKLKNIKLDCYQLQPSTDTPLYQIDSYEDIDFYIEKFVGYKGICKYSDLFERFDIKLETKHNEEKNINIEKKRKIFIESKIKYNTIIERQGKVLYFLLKVLSYDVNITISNNTCSRLFQDYSEYESKGLNLELANILIKYEINVIDRYLDTYNQDSIKITKNYYATFLYILKHLKNYLIACCYNGKTNLYIKKKMEVKEKYKELYNKIKLTSRNDNWKLIFDSSIFSDLDEIQNIQNKNTKYTKQNFKRKH